MIPVQCVKTVTRVGGPSIVWVFQFLRQPDLHLYWETKFPVDVNIGSEYLLVNFDSDPTRPGFIRNPSLRLIVDAEVVEGGQNGLRLLEGTTDRDDVSAHLAQDN